MDSNRPELRCVNLLSMNSDCIYKLFECLELDDICSISATCKTLRILANDYFQRRYNEKLFHGMRIIAINGKILLYPHERSTWSFSQCFDYVIVNVDRLARNMDANRFALPMFIRNHCSKYLKIIQFRSMLLYHSVGESIGSVLENVQTVAFSECDLEGTYQHILKHCRNMTSLIVEETYGHKIEHLLLETYPKLVQFDCRYYGRVLLKNNLKTFLRRHPNLTRLTWCFHARIREAEFSDKTLECIDVIVNNGTMLKELFLSFDGSYNLKSVCDKLQMLYDREHFERLEMDFRYTTLGYKVSDMILEHGHHLTTLNHLSGIHFCDFPDFGSAFLPILTTMSNLRVLQLDSVSSAKRLSNVPVDSLWSLEELYIGSLDGPKFIQNFILQVKTLKMIAVTRCKFNISKLNLPMLNDERKKIVLNGRNLIIYLNIFEKKQGMAECVKNDDIVKLKFVEFETSQWSLSNPFIQKADFNR